MLNIDIDKVFSIANQMQRQGVTYKLGAKANIRALSDGTVVNPRSTGSISTPVDTIDHIDCSGFSRYILFQASGGEVDLPDGSQAQRGELETLGDDNTVAPITDYDTVNDDLANAALYICFIKPNTNGCGAIGHVWLVYKAGRKVEAVTLESHGGAGVVSRKWDTPLLSKEFFSGFQIV